MFNKGGTIQYWCKNCQRCLFLFKMAILI